MKRKLKVTLIVIAILAVIILAGLHKGLPDGKASGTGNLPHSTIIKIAAPQRRAFAETCRWFGKVESRNRTRIIALETGRIVSITASGAVWYF